MQVKERLVKMGHLQPLNIFLRQEIDRMQLVVTAVRSTLNDLKLAIDGTIVMSENLRDALDSMYDARIPATWKRVSTVRACRENKTRVRVLAASPSAEVKRYRRRFRAPPVIGAACADGTSRRAG